MRKTFLSKIEGLGKISMDLPGWGKNPALSRSESTPVRRCGSPENGEISILGWVGYQQELKAPLCGLLDQLVHFWQMYWAKTLSGGNRGWVGLGQGKSFRVLY